MPSRSLILGFSFFALVAPVSAQPIDPVNDVAQRLIGTMDTSAQAAQNSKRPNVRMTT